MNQERTSDGLMDYIADNIPSASGEPRMSRIMNVKEEITAVAMTGGLALCAVGLTVAAAIRLFIR